MRTVHEPEITKAPAPVVEPPPSGKKSIKLKLANGGGNGKGSKTIDVNVAAGEEGQDKDPKAEWNNIRYVPAHHPVTGQAGFMIHYPPDIIFSGWESDMPANELMRLLRRQLHWAEEEGRALKLEMEEMERQKREEWMLKEILLDGVLDAELSKAKLAGVLDKVSARVRRAMDEDASVGAKFAWSHGVPAWRTAVAAAAAKAPLTAAPTDDGDVEMADADDLALDRGAASSPAPAPRRVSKTGGGGGDEEGEDQDPYDNILAGMMAGYEERERIRSMANTPAKGPEEDSRAPRPPPTDRAAAAEDAAGALLNMGKA